MADVNYRINKIHGRPLHEGQILGARTYFVEKKTVAQFQFGRNGGKTEMILYIACVAALLNPGWWVMIVCPQIKQGKKIYWHKKRLQNYAPPKYIKEISSTDMRVEFLNGSLISVEGCENYENLRGAKPNLVLYDEFQLHSREFHIEVMEPNLVEKSSTLLVFGTPPKQRSAYYVDFRAELLQQIKDGQTDKAYYEFPSAVNPVNDKAKLAERKAKLIKSGDKVTWEREYEGKLVFGGEGAIFPKWNPDVHMKNHEVLMSALEGDKSRLRWYTICDPGTTSCFGILFVVHNPYTQQIFVLDEIYEKDRGRMDSRQIWNRITKKWDELYPNAPTKTWKVIYDEAAAWFQREIQANFKYPMTPSDKYSQRNAEEDDISRIRMAMAEEGIFNVSKRCTNFQWEIESYMTDEEGRFPDVNDHLINCLSGDTLVETVDGPTEIAKLVGREGYLYSRNGKISKFTNVHRTRTQVPMVEVEFSNGTTVKCTPDHKFLDTHGNWVKAACLSNGVLIQCDTYESTNTESERAELQRQAIQKISWREIFHAWAEKITPSGLGALQWAYPQGFAYSSFGREPSEQRHKEPSLSFAQGAHQRSYDRGATRAATRMDGQDISFVKRLARDRRGESVALAKFQKAMGQYAFSNKIMRAVRQVLSSQKNRSVLIPILSSKLPCNRSAQAAQVTRVRPTREADTYCMSVEDTHCLAVNGGIIVHNCAQYLMQRANWKLVEKATVNLVPDNFRKHAPQDIDPSTWADSAVESSLGYNDDISDFFH